MRLSWERSGPRARGSPFRRLRPQIRVAKVAWLAPPCGSGSPLLSPQLLPGGRVHRLGFETPTQLPAGKRRAQAGLLRPGHTRSPGSGGGNGASQSNSCRGCLAVVNPRPLLAHAGGEGEAASWAAETPRPPIGPSTNEEAVRPTGLPRKSHKLCWAGLCLLVPPIAAPLPLPQVTLLGVGAEKAKAKSQRPESKGASWPGT